jgi:hypothetical protein
MQSSRAAQYRTSFWLYTKGRQEEKEIPQKISHFQRIPNSRDAIFNAFRRSRRCVFKRGIKFRSINRRKERFVHRGWQKFNPRRPRVRAGVLAGRRDINLCMQTPDPPNPARGPL